MLGLILRHLARFRRDQRGAVLIEMTLVAPLMLMLSAGVFE
ncbi:MAG: pilus assembly protein, partial [Mesorhizobium sp.]